MNTVIMMMFQTATCGSDEYRDDDDDVSDSDVWH